MMMLYLFLNYFRFLLWCEFSSPFHVSILTYLPLLVCLVFWVHFGSIIEENYEYLQDNKLQHYVNTILFIKRLVKSGKMILQKYKILRIFQVLLHSSTINYLH